MSYQTSIHFDPTALLIIKNEVDNSIQLVESAVSSLVEDQTLPFGIDDALNQFEQCAQVLALIDMPNLATIAQDSAQLMRKIMQNPSEIQQQDVTALSNGTSILKRYVEFICLQEVKVTPFLLSTLNRLELALGKPLTQEGSALASLLDCVTPDFQLPPISSQPKSVHVHRLYKLVLSKALKKQPYGADLQGFKLVGDYLADTAQHMPSQQYWQLVQIAFSDLENTLWHEARLRTLITVERHIATFFTQPDTFEPSLEDVANILNLCVSQDSNIAEHLRHQLNIQDEVLTNTQLQLYSRHLYGPDFNTMHTISTLVTEEISEVRNAIEHNYQNISAERIEELQVKLKEIANIFTVLNLNKISHNLTHQAQLLNADILRDENFVQQFMNCIQSAINAVGVLERKHNSNRLQFAVNNTNISLDRLDEAHEVLLNEAKILIDSTSQTLTKYLDDRNLENLENAANQIDEISGAMLFLNGQAGQEALKVASSFVQQQFETKQEISEEQIDAILDALASADMLIDNLRNKQPVMCSMFDVALQSSHKLKNVA